jgi:hypothetical protein
LKNFPHLGAALVAEVAEAIREYQQVERVARANITAQQVFEPTIERLGGEEHRRKYAAEEECTEPCFTPAHRRPSGDELLRGSLAYATEAVLGARARLEPLAEIARHATASEYWASNPARQIPDAIFAGLAADSAIAMAARAHPPWWGRFLSEIQRTLVHFHPAAGLLIDSLPALRASAIKKTLEAVVAEWCEENADRWGLYEQIHYRMVADRAAKKAVLIERWFAESAPGYLNDVDLRCRLHEQL